MRRNNRQALLVVAVTLVAATLRAVYEYEGMVRSSSLASSLQPPRRLGCAVDDAMFDAEAEKVKAGRACGAITAVASYWVDAPAAGASPLFASRIIGATAENHRAVAAASGVRYVRGTAGHPRCGKMRFVRDTLATLEEGEWLMFLDGDAALSCGAWSVFSRAVCRRSTPQSGYRLVEPLSLIAGSKYGVFLVRNDAWAQDYLDRFATALEARPLLCSTSTFPENAAAASVTTEADRCHYARVTSLLDHAPHLVSVEAKRDPDAVERFVAGVRNATACWTRPRRARVLDRGRAILKPGIAPRPFVPIRYDPDDQAPFSPLSALCGGLGICPGPKKCYEKFNDDRATYKEGVRAAYKCAEGPPGSKWNLAGDLPPTTIRRRANAKELRRAYERARQELKMIELEALPKQRKIN